MIRIKECRVSSDNKTIYISSETNVGSNFTSINLWTDETFKDYTKAKAITINGTTNKEVLIVKASSFGWSSFDGIYFIEFNSNAPGENCDNCAEPAMAVITNLVTYYKCAMEMLLKASKSCLNIFSSEICDNGDVANAMSVHMLIDGINSAIKINRFVDAIRLLEKLKKICKSCRTCKPCASVNVSPECSTCGETTIYYQ